jgi:hypothetical protein
VRAVGDVDDRDKAEHMSIGVAVVDPCRTVTGGAAIWSLVVTDDQ